MSEKPLLSGVSALDAGDSRATAECGRLLEILGADVCPVQSAHAAHLARGAVFDAVLADGRDAPEALAAGGAVVASVTPYGLDGPYVEHGAPPAIVDALRSRAALSLLGAHAALATVAAIRWARARRTLLRVELSGLEVLASCLGDLLPPALCRRELATSPLAERRPPRIWVVPCADGYVGVSLHSSDQRRYLATLTGVGAVAVEGADVAAALAPWASGRTRDDIFHTAQLWRLPVTPVLRPPEVLTDEQHRARGFWRRDADGVPRAGSPFRLLPARAATSVARQPKRSSASPLSGIRVLDLGAIWAGPYAGRLLAGLGAEVIKVEAPSRPDGTRRLVHRSRCQGVFADLNRGKTSLVMDLASSEGCQTFLQLVRRADVVVENFSPRVMQNFGLGFAALASENPGLVMLSMPAFGSDGPWSEYVAYGSGLEMAGGLAHWGKGDEPPEVADIPYLDYLSGAYGALGVLAAILQRDVRGTGCHLEVAQRDVAGQLLREPDSGGPFPGIDAALLASDPHLAHRGLFAVPAPSAACFHLARLPWRFEGSCARRERPAPRFGAHSRRTLIRLAGRSQAEIDRLMREGLVRGARADHRRVAQAFS